MNNDCTSCSIIFSTHFKYEIKNLFLIAKINKCLIKKKLISLGHVILLGRKAPSFREKVVVLWEQLRHSIEITGE